MTGFYRKGQMGSSGSFGGSGNYATSDVDDVFSTYTYEGFNSASSNDIVNGIDLSGEGGMVWIRDRGTGTTGGKDGAMVDTARGDRKVHHSHSHIYESTFSGTDDGITFNSNGFSIKGTVSDLSSTVNITGTVANNHKYVSWSFRKASKFFDMVTYTGNGSARTLSHSLGVVPGMIMIKSRDSHDNWAVYHRALDGSAPEDNYLTLNTNAGVADSADWWNDTAPTNTSFTVGTDDTVNKNSVKYIAYIFGHDVPDNGIIKCGSYTGNGATDSSGTPVSIDLGFEPQWLLIKSTTASTNWTISDSIRGFSSKGGHHHPIFPHTEDQEYEIGYFASNHTPLQVVPRSTGFEVYASSAGSNSGVDLNTNGETYIYMAIRRGGTTAPTSASQVFDATYITNGNGVGYTQVSTTNPPFPIDMVLNSNAPSTSEWGIGSRITGENHFLQTDTTVSERQDIGWLETYDRMKGLRTGGNGGRFFGTSNPLSFYWKRAYGFFDVVPYKGTGSNRTMRHNLGKPPERMWVKNRDSAEDWAVYHGDATNYLKLNENNATADDSTYWNDTAPTSKVFTLGTNDDVNHSAEEHVAYLFATLAGISKVGTFSHTNGSSTNVDCGFSSGSKLVIAKRTDATGDWYVWNSVRGIVSGNDPYIPLNTNAAEITNTDYIDPLNSGFQISSSFGTGSYFFYAIAT